MPGTIICIFILYSFIGWIYETIFCTVKTGQWQNRGFLYGPVCPIYGAGAVAISFVRDLFFAGGLTFPMWQVFLISVVGSVVLEYTTSYILEKLFHAMWWDYSDLPFNLHGRVSLFTSLGFGFAGLLVVYWIAPITEQAVGKIPPVFAEYAAYILIAIVASDITLTVTVLLHFDKMVISAEDRLNQRMEQVVDTTIRRTNRVKENVSIRQKSLSGRISQMGRVGQSAIRRVSTFRRGRREIGIRNKWRKSVAKKAEKSEK